MTSFFRVLRLFSLVAWIGGLFFFLAAVAPVAFRMLPDAHAAGAVVRGTLIVLHRMAFIAGAIYMIATLTLIATQRDSHVARAGEVLLVLMMLIITAYSHFSVLPRMEMDRRMLGGDVMTAATDEPHRRHFERLHKLSANLEGVIFISGTILICLAPLPNRSMLDRIHL